MTRKDYREAAKAFYANQTVKIMETANVQVMADGGAFVDAVVWVSDEVAALYKKEQADDRR